MVYLIHYKDERGRLSHWVVFIEGSLSHPKETYVLRFTHELIAQLKRLDIAYEKVNLSGDADADNCPVCSAIQ